MTPKGNGPAMVFLKACPKCKGDLAMASDIYGDFLECLQCGLIKDRTKEAATAGRRPVSDPNPQRKAA